MSISASDIAVSLFGSWVGKVDRLTLRADLTAGFLGALLVLPQGIAFASLAGLPPEYGLYSAIVPGVVAALFGSSWHVVSGPTNANSLALFAALTPLAVAGSPAYIQLALAVTVMVGVMQWLIGALRLGSLANFVSPAALRGFMSGAAILIVLHSLVDLLGLVAPPKHGLGTLFHHIGAHAAKINPAALLVSVFTIICVPVLRRWLPRWPNMLLALIIATILSAILNANGQSTHWESIDTVGRIPAVWPRFQWPGIGGSHLSDLFPIAFALTIVALGQAISIAKAVALRSGQAIDANREFCGQGLSNIVGGFFSSYVSCGSLNRSMPNFEAGAKTPLSAVFASLWLLLLLAFSASLLAFIPKPAIAALLIVVAWSLLDIPGWRQLWALSRQDFLVSAATALATITIRMEFAILLGTILSLLIYLYRTSRPRLRILGFDIPACRNACSGRPFIVRDMVDSPLPECPQLKMVRMEGDVYFGAVAHVADSLRKLRSEGNASRHLLVMSRGMNFIDLPAAELWRSEMTARRADGGDLYFHRPRPEVLELWQHIGFVDALGRDHIFTSKRIALAEIFQRLDRSVCAHCSARVFEECQKLPPALP